MDNYLQGFNDGYNRALESKTINYIPTERQVYNGKLTKKAKRKIMSEAMKKAWITRRAKYGTSGYSKGDVDVFEV